jgi:hypothetical protein
MARYDSVLVMPYLCLGTRPMRLCVAVCAALVLLSPDARAALGDDVSAIASDQARLQATVRVAAMNGYTIHELTPPEGVARIREYVGSSGKVFAVSWSGGWRPRLRDLMGSRYDQFVAATRGQRRARGPVRIETPEMVVVMGSYLRNSWGHVYLVDLAPPGWPKGVVGGAP